MSTMMARYLELATKVVLEPPSSFTRPHLHSCQISQNQSSIGKFADWTILFT